MPPKSRKRRTPTNGTTASNETASTPALPPDRGSWPGWVEIESEPALFNVMLKDMGVRGLKVQEVLGLEHELLAILPRPVHALIFLFRYKDIDAEKLEPSCPKHVWFANQVPDHACATVALLNIVNNIPDLEMGPELESFKDFTRDLDPLRRGDAIDGFTFVKRIHNSFASESDMLNADLLMKQKENKARKRQKAAEAREAKAKAKATPKKATKVESLDGASSPPKTSGRLRKGTKATPESSSRPSSKQSSTPDADFEATTKVNTPGTIRRSERKPQPRKINSYAVVPDEDEEEGFHFIAYMPIQGHVWKLDGMDEFPQDMGSYEEIGDWLTVATPILQSRMAQYEEGQIEFNLMSIVQDPVVRDRADLAENIKVLQTIDTKLDELSPGWQELDDGETKKETLVEASELYGFTQSCIDNVKLPPSRPEEIRGFDCPIKLMQLRRETISQQAGIRASVRDEMESASADAEKASHQRHDYGSFVRSWLGALAEEEALQPLLESAE